MKVHSTAGSFEVLGDLIGCISAHGSHRLPIEESTVERDLNVLEGLSLLRALSVRFLLQSVLFAL